ncbi:MAG: type II toxin-antitoxin system HicB family antitoxin [Anaerolineae bacterium]
MNQQLGVKDDRSLFEMIRRERERRRALGLPDEPEEVSDPRTVKAEYQRMQQARTAPWTYYVVIEYRNGVYHAYALSFPEVTAQGETVEAVKAEITQALQAHFAALRARDEAVPMREYKRVDTVEVSFEEVPAQPAAGAEEKMSA